MKDLNAARGQISDVVSQVVVETFNNMFGQHVLANVKEPFTAPDNVVLSCVRLHHGDTTADFCFRFDMHLLLQAASGIFTKEYIKANPVIEDLACEIANIVCARVKGHLNNQGYDTEMDFPFIPKPEQASKLLEEERVHMHFFYRDSSAKQGVGVAVNFVVG